MKQYSKTEMYCTLSDRVQSIFDHMSEKDKNFLCYLLNPNNTAIGAAYSYNEQTIRTLFVQRIFDIIDNTPQDGTKNFTLCKVIEGIQAGKY